jgi:hypothetical protein
MKATIRVLCFLVLFMGNFHRAGAASTNSFRLAVELQDGSRVVGKSGDEKFEFHSEILGEMKLPLEQIGLIECQPKTNTVKLTTANGDKLAVSFVTREIHIETSFGNVKVPVDTIQRLQVSVVS